MANELRGADKQIKWLSPDGPLPWLAYLVLFFLPWVIERPTGTQFAAGLLGVAVFLPIYFASFRLEGRALIACVAATLLLSFALIPSHGNWTVISIYAAAMAGDIRPPRRAAMLIGVLSLATVAAGVVSGQHPLYWVLGVFLMVMIGYANVSRAMLEDKNRALAAAQEQVRQMAATAERERIGRDLHDLLGRSLTLIAIKSDLAARLAGHDAPRAGREMREIGDTAREALAEVRAAIAGMTTANLGRELELARSALAAAGIGCTIDAPDETLEQGAGAVLAMALREAVTNVIRHSGARHCRIVVTAHPEGVDLSVEDDGDGAGLEEGVGLAGVRARLAAAGGALTLEGLTGGTRFLARLPLGTAL